MKTWYSIKAQGEENAEIDIFDEIGYWGIRAQDFIRDLRGLGPVKNIKVRVNSPGGDVFDGVAIHNVLKRHDAYVTVEVYGIAASIASIIAMAGNKIIMPENTWMFIHDPLAIVVGDADDMREMADALEKIAAGLIASYVSKTGKDEKEVRKWMANDTWFTAAEALEAGLADEVSDAVKLAANLSNSRFKNLPELLKPLAEKPDPDPVPEPAPAPEPDPAPQPTVDQIRAEAEKRVRDILDLCIKAGVPNTATKFLDGGLSVEQVRAKLADADGIRARCKAARCPERADAYIAAGMTVKEVADDLFDVLVAKQAPEIDNSLAPANERRLPDKSPSFDPRAIADRYQQKESIYRRKS